MKKLFVLEDKIKNWIETHRFVWCSILFTFGFVLGYITINIPKVGLLYGGALVIVELSAGGSGLPDKN